MPYSTGYPEARRLMSGFLHARYGKKLDMSFNIPFLSLSRWVAHLSTFTTLSNHLISIATTRISFSFFLLSSNKQHMAM